MEDKNMKLRGKNKALENSANLMEWEFYTHYRDYGMIFFGMELINIWLDNGMMFSRSCLNNLFNFSSCTTKWTKVFITC